jgi:hypothetical protein
MAILACGFRIRGVSLAEKQRRRGRVGNERRFSISVRSSSRISRAGIVGKPKNDLKGLSLRIRRLILSAVRCAQVSNCIPRRLVVPEKLIDFGDCGSLVIFLGWKPVGIFREGFGLREKGWVLLNIGKFPFDLIFQTSQI